VTKVATPEDYTVLGLSEDTSPEEAKRAYHRMKALYAQGALATYSLLENDQRGEILDRIERAYMRVSQDLRAESADGPPVLPMHGLEEPVPPGPDEGVGPYLMQRREFLGFTIKEIAQRTRIRSTYIEHIESESYQDLPAPVYLRGFILQYAHILGLPEPEKLAEAFLAQAGKKEG
jgi:flagellar biosynthesis protein FlhG